MKGRSRSRKRPRRERSVSPATFNLARVAPEAHAFQQQEFSELLASSKYLHRTLTTEQMKPFLRRPVQAIRAWRREHISYGHATWRQQLEAYNALMGIVVSDDGDDDDDDDEENCAATGGPRTPQWQKMHDRYCRFCSKNTKNTEHDDDDDQKPLAELFAQCWNTMRLEHDDDDDEKPLVHDDDDDEKPLVHLRQHVRQVMDPGKDDDDDDAPLTPQKSKRLRKRSLKSMWDDNDSDDILVSDCGYRLEPVLWIHCRTD